jgi:hypothetical protein
MEFEYEPFEGDFDKTGSQFYTTRAGASTSRKGFVTAERDTARLLSQVRNRDDLWGFL